MDVEIQELSFPKTLAVGLRMDNIGALDGQLFITALHQGRNTAYKGVVCSVEGTVLTVAKDIDTEATAA